LSSSQAKSEPRSIAETLLPLHVVGLTEVSRASISVGILRQADTVSGIEPTPHAFDFLKWATEFHRPYWLTTRDAHGQHSGILRTFRLAMNCVWSSYITTCHAGSPARFTASMWNGAFTRKLPCVERALNASMIC
jgi:hypothetical protein